MKGPHCNFENMQRQSSQRHQSFLLLIILELIFQMN
jgi:hypothetical protein